MARKGNPARGRMEIRALSRGGAGRVQGLGGRRRGVGSGPRQRNGEPSHTAVGCGGGGVFLGLRLLTCNVELDQTGGGGWFQQWQCWRGSGRKVSNTVTWDPFSKRSVN